MIYNIPKLMDDELLYSYINRFINSNAWNIQFFKNNIINNTSNYAYDLRFYIMEFAELINKDPYELFLNTTLYHAVAPLVNKERQTQIIIYNFRKRDKFPSLISEHFRFIDCVNYCPECVKEDKDKNGFAYIHRKHNIPGVKVCYKHNVPLIRVAKSSKNHHKVLGQYEDITVDDYNYSIFASDFLDAKFDTNQEELLKCLGLEWKNIEVEELLKLLFSYYKKVSNIVLPTKKNNFNYNGYKLVSEYSSIIIKVNKVKEKPFITTPYGFEIGWRSPYSDDDMSEEEKYKQILKFKYNGEFILDDRFKNVTNRIKHIHVPSGKSFNREPYILLNKSSRFVYGDVIKKINDRIYHKDFITEYLGDKKVKVKCKKCGSEIIKYLPEWNLNKKCTFCSRKEHLEKKKLLFEQELFKATNGQYILVGEYKDRTSSAKFKHLKCGKVFNMKVKNIMTGSRCSCLSKDIECFIEEYNHIFNNDYSIEFDGNRYLIKDNKNGNSFYCGKRELLQLAKEYTSSHQVKNIKISKSVIVLDVIKSKFNIGDIFNSDEIIISNCEINVLKVLYYLNRKGVVKGIGNKTFIYLGGKDE